MRLPRRNDFWITAGLVGWLAALASAQSLPNAVSSAESSPVVLKSPVDLFRELLAMEPAERDRALAVRPPETRRRIVEKLQEYQLLPPDVREWRLRETELRYYMAPLMSLPRTNRAARLALIPEETRKLVEERLETWDLLPPGLQTESRNSELIQSYFSRFESAAAHEQWREMIRKTSPEQRAELEEGINRWRGLSPEERQKMLGSFYRIFDLTAEEREKALDTVPDEERKQMEATLTAYTKLTPAQRRQCIHSFNKFTSMTAAERQEFLKKAERWKEMPIGERQAWRDLVLTAPIMPPLDGPRAVAPSVAPPSAPATN